MSAPILRRGDRIHLALPISPSLYGDALAQQITDDYRTVGAVYAAQGVEVVGWSHNSLLRGPMVVAVFRPGREGHDA